MKLPNKVFKSCIMVINFKQTKNKLKKLKNNSLRTGFEPVREYPI